MIYKTRGVLFYETAGQEPFEQRGAGIAEGLLKGG
jgi:hypothetical protein